MNTCCRLFHRYKVTMECDECNHMTIKSIQLYCHSMTQKIVMKKVGCSYCKNELSCGIIDFSCERGSKDSWNKPRIGSGISVSVENIDPWF